jgi:3-methyladenine DNA glycosylase AlkD
VPANAGRVEDLPYFPQIRCAGSQSQAFMIVIVPLTVLLQEIRARLHEHGSEAMRRGVQRFFLEPVQTHGVPSAVLRRIEREFRPQLRQLTPAERGRLCTELMRSGYVDESMLVSYIYENVARQCTLCEFRLCERWMERHVTNWSACDAICMRPLRAVLENEPELVKELPAWTASPHIWKRRAAAVALIYEAKAGRHPEIIFPIAAALCNDPQDLVRKGAGWLLKETYPARPEETVLFLLEHKAHLPRHVLRYAAEKMTPLDRSKVMS